MIHLIKYVFVITVMFTASVFAGEPATWNLNTFNSGILEIKDDQGENIAMQVLSELQQDMTWSVSALNSKIAEIKDAAGTVVDMMILTQDPEHYRLIEFNGKGYLLP